MMSNNASIMYLDFLSSPPLHFPRFCTKEKCLGEDFHAYFPTEIEVTSSRMQYRCSLGIYYKTFFCPVSSRFDFGLEKEKVGPFDEDQWKFAMAGFCMIKTLSGTEKRES